MQYPRFLSLFLEVLVYALLVTVKKISLKKISLRFQQWEVFCTVLLSLQGGGEKFQQLPKNTFTNYDLALVQLRHSNISCCSPFSMTLQAVGKQTLEVHYHQDPAKKIFGTDPEIITRVCE